MIVNAVDIMLFGSWPQALVQWYVWTPWTRPRSNSKISSIFYKSLTLWTIDGGTSKLCYRSTSKFCYMSTSKLCIYTDYMVAFWNNVWMYYVEKLNNGEYPTGRKCLSVKYGFKYDKQPLGSLHCRYYVCDPLRTYGQYRVNREDVSHHCFMYLYFVSPFFHFLLTFFYCISFLIIGWNGIILL
jgi:hypothetical protein